ncbi:MAG: hypothetical protein WA139_01810 [Candidatus Aenigmatarchaeota archaeon]
MYRITQEGRHYLQKGFPEKHLLQALRTGKRYLNDINIDKKEAAVFWAKKNKWIKVDGNIIMLTFFGRMALPFQKMEIEDALVDVEKKGLCNERYAKELISRKLIDEIGKENLSLKLKNIFWKKDEMERKPTVKTANIEVRELKRKTILQQKTIENLQDYMRSIEKRLRNVEQRKQ